MNILFLNWKDITHPKKGGAEIYLMHLAIELVELGHTVSWFSSSYNGAKSEEVINGVHMYRKFGLHTIYFLGWTWYRRFIKDNNTDIIIDVAGGLPMFAPWFTNKPVVFSMMHMGDEERDAYLPFPLSKMGKYLYYFFFWTYRNHHTLTISDSSTQDLVYKLGFKSNHISIIEPLGEVVEFNGDVEQLVYNKRDEILFIGRLMPIKRAEDAIRAFDVFAQDHPDYIFNIVGGLQDQAYVDNIKSIIEGLESREKIFLRGNVSEQEKKQYLESAKLLLVTSKKEGFGLIVYEANHYAIPVIGYDVHGLRDSIKQGVNGRVVENNNIQDLARMMNIVDNIEQYHNICNSSIKYVQGLPKWNKKGKELEGLCATILSR